MRKRDLSSRARHVRVHLGFCYDMLDSREVYIEHIKSPVNPANALTAAEEPMRFANSLRVINNTAEPTECYESTF